MINISEGKDYRTRNVTATQKGRGAVTKTIALWDEVQDKQKMAESSWQGLMQSLGEFVIVADSLDIRFMDLQLGGFGAHIIWEIFQH